MAEAKTHARIDWPTVMLIGTKAFAPPAYTDALNMDGYIVVPVKDAQAAREMMAKAMPHVVIMSRAVPMPDHRIVHETASAVGAEVLVVPDDSHPELVRLEVEIATNRVLKRRQKR